ncbi:MAG: amino acid ABC transporter permease [Magnetospirillum sp.]|nr:amino acid ABC transporter permease [Magnetospirillum sp.]
METLNTILEVFFNAEIAVRVFPFLLRGLGMTLLLCALVIPLGLAGGLALAWAASLERRWLRVLCVVYVDFFRAFPPLVLLIFLFFGLPFAGIDLPSIVAVGIGFFLNASSYYGEIFRAGVESVPKGQWEAARSTGLTRFQTMTAVILPQATRNVLPDLIGNTLEVAKLTSIASVVALGELLHTARLAQSLVYNPTPIVMAAMLYLALFWPVVRLLSRLEHRNIARR